jgi:hypothetical protein
MLNQPDFIEKRQQLNEAIEAADFKKTLKLTEVYI